MDSTEEKQTQVAASKLNQISNYVSDHPNIALAVIVLLVLVVIFLYLKSSGMLEKMGISPSGAKTTKKSKKLKQSDDEDDDDKEEIESEMDTLLDNINNKQK